MRERRKCGARRERYDERRNSTPEERASAGAMRLHVRMCEILAIPGGVYAQCVFWSKSLNFECHDTLKVFP